MLFTAIVVLSAVIGFSRRVYRCAESNLTWLQELPGKPVFVGYPVAYDFMFVYWYLIHFTGKRPFSHSALDIKTYAMAALGLPYRDSVKRNMPKAWMPKAPHTHVALDDAIEQGQLFCNMVAAHKESMRVPAIEE